MGSEVTPQVSRRRVSIPSRLTIARLLFLAGALLCGLYLVEALTTSHQLAFAPTRIGATVVLYSVLIVEQLVWAWLLGNPTLTKFRGARWTVLLQFTFFGSSLIHQHGEASPLMIMVIGTMTAVNLTGIFVIRKENNVLERNKMSATATQHE